MSRTTRFTTALATLALVGAGFGAVSTAPAGAAAGAEERRAQTLAGDLLSPLSLAVARDGTRYFSQNFMGVLHRQKPGTKTRTVYTNKDGFEVGAISERRGQVRFAISKNQRRAVLMGMGRQGKPRAIANLGAHEKKRNPDRKVTYGFRNLGDGCAAQLPGGMPATYRGIVETHPYATMLAANGTTYVADAAANAVFAVPRPGKVRTVAVLPPTALEVNAAFAQQAGMPDCVVGKTYRFEAVPTDVEQGPDGNLYVTTLPGGPEDGSMGAAASVYRVNPRTGKVTKVAGGLVSATGLAVAADGDLFVAELFRGRIARIAKGAKKPRTYLEVPLPGDVELARGDVFATVSVLSGLSGEPGDKPAGKVVRIRR